MSGIENKIIYKIDKGEKGLRKGQKQIVIYIDTLNRQIDGQVDDRQIDGQKSKIKDYIEIKCNFDFFSTKISHILI